MRRSVVHVAFHGAAALEFRIRGQSRTEHKAASESQGPIDLHRPDLRKAVAVSCWHCDGHGTHGAGRKQSAEPFTSQLNERMRRGQGDPGKLDLKTSRPDSGKWEKPIRQEPGN